MLDGEQLDEEMSCPWPWPQARVPLHENAPPFCLPESCSFSPKQSSHQGQKVQVWVPGFPAGGHEAKAPDEGKPVLHVGLRHCCPVGPHFWLASKEDISGQEAIVAFWGTCREAPLPLAVQSKSQGFWGEAQVALLGSRS
jgi:hypothetical protein